MSVEDAPIEKRVVALLPQHIVDFLTEVAEADIPDDWRWDYMLGRPNRIVLLAPPTSSTSIGQHHWIDFTSDSWVWAKRQSPVLQELIDLMVTTWNARLLSP